MPDSLCGLISPTCIVHDSATNTVYVAGGRGGCILAIDATTARKIARIANHSYASALCHNRQNNMLYCSNHDDGNITVIDCAANQVIATVPAGHTPGTLCYNSLECPRLDGHSDW
jgi:YVTN family beta-propeller protein